MDGPNPKVDSYLGREKSWRAEFEKLREIILACGLAEDFKWGHPCYSDGGRNIVLMHGFNDYCAVLFFKGALLKDPDGVLVQQTENVQAARQIRFTSLAEVEAKADAVTACIHDAMAVEKAGLKVDFKKTAEFSMPEEFRIQLDDDAALKAAFEALTPGRQRGYLLHFSSAKQAKTRQARIEKCLPKILEGLGLDE